MNDLARNQQQGAQAERPAGGWSPLQGLFGFDPFQGALRNWDYGFDVTRTENGYEIDVPVPGFNSSNIDITLKDDILSVNGKNERRNFSRSFTVPEDVDAESISAKVSDGMLCIKLQRRPEAQPRKIEVT